MLAVMVVSVLFVVEGCSGNSGIQAKLEELKNRVENLVSKKLRIFDIRSGEYAENQNHNSILKKYGGI